MIKKILLPSMFIILTYGFWLSPDFKEISAGVAIFLFGMLFMEAGFKEFTGGILEKLLQKTTNKLWKSLSFGVISTTIMQSSSLVSVITISFLSAGLISLAAGIGIIFGANLGTTTGAWLIAGFGLKVKISAYAMPMLVFGIILVFQKSKYLKGIGYVLAGLGFLFLGIHYMKEGFEAFRSSIDLTAFAVSGYSGLLLFTLLGIAATVIMQSSHATLVIIITALAAQQITYENGLALAIGANVGTTVTAILGAMSSNIQGKRLAIAHLIFNLITAAIAIIFIYQLMIVVDNFAAMLGIANDDYTLKLAIFHTIFNSIGILVMIPFIQHLVDFLNDKMPEKSTSITTSKYLNESAKTLPDTAIEAVRKETLHLYNNAFEIIADGLNLKRTDIVSKQPLDAIINKTNTIISIDIDEQYKSHVKGLYAEIVAFISHSHTQISSEHNNELFELHNAGRNIVEAIKDTKHLHKNLSHYIVSDNQYMRLEYNKIRLQLLAILRHLEAVKISGDILSLDSFKLNETVMVNGKLEQLINDNKINAKMAISLMNDSTYAANLRKTLLQIGHVLFVIGDLEMKKSERSLALTEDELETVKTKINKVVL